MSGEVLFLAHRLPFPPDRGDKIRSHHVLRHIASLAPVHVATFAETEADLAAEPDLAALAASHCLIHRGKPLFRAGAEALLRNEPVSLAAWRDSRLAAYVDKVLSTRQIAAIYMFSGQMGQYLPSGFSGRVICDFVDVDSAKFEAYATARTAPLGWLHAREARLLGAEEARLAKAADFSLLVSGEEAALFRSRIPDTGRIEVLRNGVDTALLDPSAVPAEPCLASLAGPRIIFTGQMDYAPNVAAAGRAIGRIMPLIRRALPDASFHVVGRNPPGALRAWHGRDGVHVWGEVPDVRPWLAGADLALVPLEIARGVQNKVLEAMAMALPVVLTPDAATGIGGQNDVHFATGERDNELAERAIALLRDPAAPKVMGDRARRFVMEQASWKAALAPLADWLGLTRGSRRHAA